MVFISCRFIPPGSGRDKQHRVSVELRREMLEGVVGGAEWEFAVREGGKPYVVGENITFSVSHTDGCVICAVSVPDASANTKYPTAPDVICDEGVYRIGTFSRHGEIGCDTELYNGQSNEHSSGKRAGLDAERAGKIAERYFTEGEKREINSSENSLESFYRIWTAKESIVKATGEGIKALRSADSQVYHGRDTVSFLLQNGEYRFISAVTVIYG